VQILIGGFPNAKNGTTWNDSVLGHARPSMPDAGCEFQYCQKNALNTLHRSVRLCRIDDHIMPVRALAPPHRQAISRMLDILALANRY